jgi:glutamate synthase domain-containing protein 2
VLGPLQPVLQKKADVILISGFDGGTGAAPLTHCSIQEFHGN